MKKNSRTSKTKGLVRRSAAKSADLKDGDNSPALKRYLPEIFRMIEDTKFDERALRIIPAFEPEEWQFFKITDKDEWLGCIRYELILIRFQDETRCGMGLACHESHTSILRQ